MSSTQASPVNRSELVSVVAWMEIVLGAFGMLTSVFQMALVGVYEAYQSQQGQLGQPSDIMHYNVMLGVAATMFVLSLVVCLGGVGLRRRHDWARRLSIGLCYLGCLGAVALFGVLWSAVNYWATGASAINTPELSQMVGLVLKAFFASFMIAGVALLLWIAHRLKTRKVIAEFQPQSPAAPAPASPDDEPAA